MWEEVQINFMYKEGMHYYYNLLKMLRFFGNYSARRYYGLLV
jgi:hypothetical protein